MFNKKVRSALARLPSSRACQLFRDDYPSLSEWEIQVVFKKYDVDGDGHLSFAEYLQTRAYYRMLLEESTQMELQRIFSILDTDADGILLSHDVLLRIEQTGLHGVSILKQIITQAAEATRGSVKSTQYYHRDGEIAFEHFSATIHDVNRKMEQVIATKALRVIDLQQEQQQQQVQRLRKPTSVPDYQMEALRIEIDVITREIRRMKKELITDSNNALGEVCERLMATYENEQHVYECLNNFITYCNLHDVTLFRYNLEREGKQVNILNSMLLAPPHHLKTTEVMLETLLMNLTLRKQFAYYAMTGNATNLAWITRTNFIKFVKDCKLDLLSTPALKDVDITNIFAAASGTGKAMNFAQLLTACILIFKRSQHLQGPLSDADVQHLVETHIIPRAKIIRVQQLAPDISQNHVMKLLKEHIWQFKQIFSHFGIQSLTENTIHPPTDCTLRYPTQVDSRVRLDMKEFLTFARAFNIIRSPSDFDGEPNSPREVSANASIAPISLVELIREYYASKLDISITDPERREAADLNFREFLRCIQRIALAMHTRNPTKLNTARANGVTTTVFEATKDDNCRSPEKVCTPRTPRYQRRDNVLAATSPTKNCKITSTSVISRLLQTSRAIVKCQFPSNNRASQVNPAREELLMSRICPSTAPNSSNHYSPRRPSFPHKVDRRPLTSGGSPRIRIIQRPGMHYGSTTREESERYITSQIQTQP
ncbi:hypothetical protein P3T76_000100 [Phytophthora citrophthora]|uniref:EF-hand domain-containing protein n=1 Tax=Phytophthora citrophthora TaxID=4793 RepID=A0AAD9LS27_9STRA|nr:hypothetical protein P3T76_000100 [Phytophthora citrophthora]